MIDDATRQACACTPIDEASPAGANARYEAAFTTLEAEIDKLTSLQGGEVDWGRVEELAITILREQSKDFLVAAYLAHALQHSGGLAGLHCGLQLLDELCEHYWDLMQPPPKRLAARRSALQWLAERSGALIADQAHDPAACEGCLSVLEALHARVIAHFDNDDSGLGTLIRALRNAQQEAAAGRAAGLESADEELHMSESSPPVVRSATGPITDRSDALRRLEQLVEFFRKTEPHSPIGAVLARARRWGDMDFQAVISELLSRDNDVRKRLWDVLGLNEDG